MRWSRIDGAAAVAAAAVGLVLAVAPHLAALARDGSIVYLGDGDDVFYLAVSRAPFRGESALRDPFCPDWEPRPTLYSWLQFVPLAALGRGLGVDLLTLPLLWRSVGGTLLGLSLFFLFRRLLAGTRHPTAWALGGAVTCLADAGFVGGQTLYGAVGLVRAMAGGVTPLRVPNALGQYRVVTPLLNLPALLALAALLVPTASRRGAAEFVAGALALGVCVHLYFFFWTAAVVAIAVLLAGWAAARRRAEVTFAAAVLAGGMALGAPQVVANARAFADPEVKLVLQRLSRGRALAPGDPARARYRKNVWAYGKLAFGAAVVVGLGAWRLAPVWALSASGFLLANSALVTGLEFENFHWVYVHAPFGEVLAVAGSALLLDRAAWRVRWLWVVPVGLALLALAWRPYEAVRCPEAVEQAQTLRSLLPLRPALARLGPSDVLAGPRAANVALLLGSGGQLYQYDQTYASSVVPDAEVDERHALNAWLQGSDLDGYLREVREMMGRPETVFAPGRTAASVAAARGSIFRRLLSGRSAGLLGRYRPSGLLRLTSDGPPSPDRGGPWSLAGARGGWSLWSRRP